MATEPVATNADRLVTTRLTATIMPGAANRAVAADGRLDVLAGQGGVVTGIRLGDRALGRHGDHVEPGISLGHPDPMVNRAIQILSCVGNTVTLLDGPARGAAGMIYGKHGTTLAALPQDRLALAGPGERVAIEACGAGLAIEGEPDITCLSLSPALARAWLSRDADGRLALPVATILPSEAAAAGIGMPSQRFNMDLHSDQPPMDALCRDLGFGDLVLVEDQDHRFGRRHRPGWIMAGVISHGRTIAGGHGLGLMTLLTGPADRFAPVIATDANVARLMGRWGKL